MSEIEPKLSNWRQIALGAWLLGVVAMYLRQILQALIDYLGG